MKKIILNFNDNILTRDDLKKIKGGTQDESLEGCGTCMDFDQKIWTCNGTPDTGCCCNSGSDNNICG